MSLLPLGSIPSFYAERFPKDRIAVSHGEDAVTWEQLDRRSTQRAWALKDSGVGPDDFVTLALPNGTELFELTFAIWKLGATPHVVSWRMPQRELDAILDIARPKLLISPVEELISHNSGKHPDALKSGKDDPLTHLAAKYSKAMSSGGSTGRPKIIVDHTPAAADPSAPIFLMPKNDCVLNPGPLHHNAPFSTSHSALILGNTLVGMTKFDAEEALRLIAAHRVSLVCFVPTMMLRIWRLPSDVRVRFDLSSLTQVWHMAAPMPPWLKEAWIEWLGPERIWELYGGTENQGHTMINGSEWLAHRGSVGRALNCEIRVLDETGNDVPQGEVGEVFFKPAAGTGSTYHYMGAEPRRAGRGFESLGDFGWQDDEGYLYLADRRTDLILSGGANIYPAEVEAAIMEHPGVEVAVVVGLPNEDLGAVVHAIVKPQDDWASSLDASDIASFVEERLVKYKLPRSYEFTTKQLRDDAGKVRRSELREACIQARL